VTDNDARKPASVSLRANLIGGAATGGLKLTVTPADRIEVEPSPTLKYLGLRSGYIQVPNRVIVVMEGKRHEITVDSLPDEQQGA
jgi:hypothetical protein